MWFYHEAANFREYLEMHLMDAVIIRLGLKEQTIFPEIEFEKVDKVRGLEITIVTSARTDEEGRLLLELLGMPFSKE